MNSNGGSLNQKKKDKKMKKILLSILLLIPAIITAAQEAEDQEMEVVVEIPEHFYDSEGEAFELGSKADQRARFLFLKHRFKRADAEERAAIKAHLLILKRSAKHDNIKLEKEIAGFLARHK